MSVALNMLFHPELYENAEEWNNLLAEYRVIFGDIPEYVPLIYSPDEQIAILRIVLSRGAAFPVHGPQRRWIEREIPSYERFDPVKGTLH